MSGHTYQHYLFFEVTPGFYQLPAADQAAAKKAFLKLISDQPAISITPYAAAGFTTNATFMLWCRAGTPDAVQNLLPPLWRTALGAHLRLVQTYFGLVRPSPYSGRTGKPDQDMNQFTDRLPYFILYPFTKTHSWYQLSPENRRSIMGQHIKTGVAHPNIRQCLLYSTGLGNQEFMVSYETASLEEFQDLVMEMRSTIGRPYTLSDTPIYTCIHKSAAQLMDWL